MQEICVQVVLSLNVQVMARSVEYDLGVSSETEDMNNGEETAVYLN